MNKKIKYRLLRIIPYIAIIILGGLCYTFVTNFFRSYQDKYTLEQAEKAIDYAESLIAENGPLNLRHGNLYAGNNSLHQNALVDRVERFTGFGCTIFLGDERISTTAKTKNSGKRALATKANHKIIQSVLRGGKTFKGVTNTIGKNLLVIYKPLTFENSETAGMLAVYKDYDVHLSQASSFKTLVGIVIGGCTFIALILVFNGQQGTLKYKSKSRKLEKLEKDLRLQNDELQQLGIIAAEVEQAIAVIGKDDRIQWVNPSFINSFGYSWEEIIGEKASTILSGPETDPKETARMTNAIFNDKKPYISTQTQYRKDGSAYWAKVYLTPVLNNNNDLEKYIAISLDITFEIKANNRIKQSETIFKEINRSLDSCIYLYNVQKKKYEFISNNSKDILGMPSKDFLMGKSHTEFFVHPDDKEMLRKENDASHDDKEIDVSYRIIINGETRWIREKSFPIYDQNKTVLKVSGICSDITDLKLKEEELAIQTDLLKKKNKEIVDSITYTKHIQNASLGTEEDRLKLFPESFVLYKPKDIVSGDFYRFDTIKTNEKQELKSFFVGDCTGHGVPGASLALLCNGILKQSLHEQNVNSPGNALAFAAEQLSGLFKHTEDGKFRDGMDAGFCVINPENNTLYFAGAGFDCWIIRNGQLSVIPGDRIHVGLYEEELKFNTTSFQLQKGDMLYLSSDGYSDQFGGKEGKKFMKKRFLETLCKIATQKTEHQKETLNEEFVQWMGDHEQTDDVCIIGVRID